jgi:hypothetical protein
VVQSAETCDIFLLDFAIAEMAENVRVCVGWISNNNTSYFRISNLQCFTLVYENFLIFMQQVTSLHSWLPREATQKHNYISIFEHNAWIRATSDFVELGIYTILDFHYYSLHNSFGLRSMKKAQVDLVIIEDLAIEQKRYKSICDVSCRSCYTHLQSTCMH